MLVFQASDAPGGVSIISFKFRIHKKMSKKTLGALALACATLALVGCETTNMKMGSPEAKTVATGGAAGSASSNASGALERCAAPPA